MVKKGLQEWDVMHIFTEFLLLTQRIPDLWENEMRNL